MYWNDEDTSLEDEADARDNFNMRYNEYHDNYYLEDTKLDEIYYPHDLANYNHLI